MITTQCQTDEDHKSCPIKQFNSVIIVWCVNNRTLHRSNGGVNVKVAEFSKLTLKHGILLGLPI